MITDDELERRLHRAGERFRAATAAEPDPDRLGPIVTSRGDARRRRVITLIATVAVAAAVAVLAVVLVRGDSRTHGAGGSGTLTGATWTITQIRDRRGTLYTPDAHAYVIFDAAGTWTGDDGCNGLAGRYGAAGDTLTFSDVTVGAVGCAPGASAVVSGLLTTGARWSIDSHELTVSGAAGAFTARDPFDGNDPARLTAARWRLDALARLGPNGTPQSRTKAPAGVTVGFTGTRAEVILDCGSTTSIPSTVGRGYLQIPSPYDSGFAGYPGCIRTLKSTFELTDKVLTGYAVWLIDDTTLTITRDSYQLVLTRAGAAPTSGPSNTYANYLS